MIEKLKLEPYIPESLIARVYSTSEGTLVGERYDTIYWARDKYLNVKCKNAFDCHVDAKLFCQFATLVKEAESVGNKLRLVLFNGATYDLDKVEGDLPSFELPELPNKSVFSFGGVERATSKNQLQKELNMVYVDSVGAVGTDSIVAGISNGTFKSATPFTVPENLHSMLNGEDAEWGISDGNLCVRFGAYEIVATLSKLPEFAWWEASRNAFRPEIEFVSTSGLRSSVTRLAYFGPMLRVSDNKILVNEEHFEPFVLAGSGETFDISNLLQILTDDTVGVALYGGNFYMKTKDAMFICCAVDLSSAGQS